MKPPSVLLILLTLCLTLPAFGQETSASTKKADTPPALAAAEQKLLGKRKFSVQWISWEKFGVANITRKDGGLYIEARQELDGNYVTLKGELTVVSAKEFKVKGELVTRASDTNEGKPCVRNETFTFKVTGKRKYWRLQEMDNPCAEHVDYVDVFFN